MVCQIYIRNHGQVKKAKIKHYSLFFLTKFPIPSSLFLVSQSLDLKLLRPKRLDGIRTKPASHLILSTSCSRTHDPNHIYMARLFAKHGVKATIICTPLNAPLFSKVIERDGQQGIEISIHVIKFPSLEAGLPEGCENLASATSPEMFNNFNKALGLLQQPLEQLLEECRPHCLVADVMFPWATEVASKLGIPRLIFHGTSYFAFCVFHCLRFYEPLKTSDFESFIVPGIPDQIKMTKSQQQKFFRGVDDEQMKLTNLAVQSEETSYGVVVNSFYELEPAYSEYYRKVIRRKAWSIGTVSLCNRDVEEKALRGNTASIDAYECLRWLELKKLNSVLYICFGSKYCFPTAQLLEIAKGLEAAGKHFIWVLKDEENMNNWLLEGFEKRLEDKGLIIRGWAPQVLILDHKAIGGFMTHCGWNSVLESVTNGVPMITWPLYAEQFYNEKLVTDVLKIGVSVGAKECSRSIDAKKYILQKDDIERSVNQLMVGEEAEEMRCKAKTLKEMARKAVEEGGSSYCDLNALLEELRLNCRKMGNDYLIIKRHQKCC